MCVCVCYGGVPDGVASLEGSDMLETWKVCDLRGISISACVFARDLLLHGVSYWEPNLCYL